MTSLAYLNDRPHSVYVMWADDVAVYVGISSDWEYRMREHGVWWRNDDEPLMQWTPYDGWSAPITHVDVWETDLTRTEARAIETATIRALLPTHNRQGFGYRKRAS